MADALVQVINNCTFNKIDAATMPIFDLQGQCVYNCIQREINPPHNLSIGMGYDLGMMGDDYTGMAKLTGGYSLNPPIRSQGRVFGAKGYLGANLGGRLNVSPSGDVTTQGFSDAVGSIGYQGELEDPYSFATYKRGRRGNPLTYGLGAFYTYPLMGDQGRTVGGYANIGKFNFRGGYNLDTKSPQFSIGIGAPIRQAGGEEEFEPHMMYDPETGKGYMAEKLEDHLRMKEMGYLHEDEMKKAGKEIQKADEGGGFFDNFDIKGYLKGEQGFIPDYKGESTKKTISENESVNKALDYTQTALTVGGMQDYTGPVAAGLDVLNTGISGARAYAAPEGSDQRKKHLENMALNATSAIPGYGLTSATTSLAKDTATYAGVIDDQSVTKTVADSMDTSKPVTNIAEKTDESTGSIGKDKVKFGGEQIADIDMDLYYALMKAGANIKILS